MGGIGIDDEALKVVRATDRNLLGEELEDVTDVACVVVGKFLIVERKRLVAVVEAKDTVNDTCGTEDGLIRTHP